MMYVMKNQGVGRYLPNGNHERWRKHLSILFHIPQRLIDSSTLEGNFFLKTRSHEIGFCSGQLHFRREIGNFLSLR